MKYFFLIFWGINAWAGGTSINGGGGGILIQNKMYLADFYEMGIHKNPFVESKGGLEFINHIRKYKKEFDLVSSGTLEIFFGKIEDISRKDPVLAAFINEALLTLNWNFSEENIKQTEDLFFCTIDAKPLQVANRQGNLVSISKLHFLKMNSINQAGLIFHEVLQSLVPEQIKDVCHHRRIVGMLFTKEFLRSDINFWNATLKHYPTGHEVLQKQPEIGSENENPIFVYSRYLLKSPLWGGPTNADPADSEAIKVARWYLFPSLDLKFADGRIQQNVSMWSSQVDSSICSAANSVKNLTVNYWHIYVIPRFNEQGQTLPRFDWKLRKTMFNVLDRSSSDPALSCGEFDLQFLKLLDAWKEKASYFRTN